MDIEPSQNVNSKMKGVLESINDVFITDMGVANLPKDRIDRLTDNRYKTLQYIQIAGSYNEKIKAFTRNIAGGTS